MSGKPSAATEKARAAFERNPKLSAKVLAQRYGISLPTVYRATWFTNKGANKS